MEKSSQYIKRGSFLTCHSFMNCWEKMRQPVGKQEIFYLLVRKILTRLSCVVACKVKHSQKAQKHLKSHSSDISLSHTSLVSFFANICSESSFSFLLTLLLNKNNASTLHTTEMEKQLTNIK